MSRRAHQEWIQSSMQAGRLGAAKQRRWAGSFHRRLRFEPLEDRRLLATITVNSLVDEADGSIVDGDISLRDALFAAALNDTINFAVSGTINLTVGTLDTNRHISINKSLTINGPGANLLTIKAYDPTPATKNGDGSRVFSISDGNFFTFHRIAISGVTLMGGDVSGDGGAILVNGEWVKIFDSVISNNAAANGGGIAGVPGYVDVVRSTITGNSANLDGGGIKSTGLTLIQSSNISGNSAGDQGGGVFTFTATDNLTVTSSSFNENSANEGGGIFHAEGDMTVTNTTLSGNSARTRGGAISIFADTDVNRISYSTITGNKADADLNGSGSGGGVAWPSIFGMFSLDHTIVAGNTRGISTRDDIYGRVATKFSLIGVNTGAIITNNGGNQIGTNAAPIDPRLGPLADNGGPTMTRALLAGSPAIDAGDAAAVAGVGDVPLYDQRGTPFGRVVDGNAVPGARIDIGAFEVQPLPAAFFGDYNQDGTVDAADYVLWRKTLGTTDVPAYSGADGNGNGSIGQEDYGVWRAHFGQTVPPPGAGSWASVEGGVGNMEGGVWSGEGGVAQQPAADPAAGYPAGVGVAAEVQADVIPARQVASLTVATFGTAGQVRHGESPATSSGTHLRALAGFGELRPMKPVAPEVSRDDALVAWLASRNDDGREDEGGEVGAVYNVVFGDGQDGPSYGDAIDNAFDALDVAVEGLVGSARL